MDPLPVARPPGETTLIDYLSARPLNEEFNRAPEDTLLTAMAERRIAVSLRVHIEYKFVMPAVACTV